jgi:hypothetical protein
MSGTTTAQMNPTPPDIAIEKARRSGHRAALGTPLPCYFPMAAMHFPAVSLHDGK